VSGSAHQIFEKYVALAREATISGDRVAAENFYQHAEHYFRIDNERRGSDLDRSAPTVTADSPANVSAPERVSNEADDDASSGWGDHRPGFI
jgi:hypothetical protein